MPDGEVAFADIPETRIEANSTRIVRLNRIIEKANIPASIGYAGIELEYDSPPGTIITSVQSVSADGSHDMVYFFRRQNSR
ncbi:MAG TPA: hypothetical protein DEA22_08955 [Blastocatellia bacterium]|nr:hypothetical protein [Blastocatellia bacterium]